MSSAPDLTTVSPAEKDGLILTLLARLDAALAQIAALQTRIDELTRPGKTPGNSSLPPSKGQKPNQPQKPERTGPRAGSLGRKGGGRALTADPDETVVARGPPDASTAKAHWRRRISTCRPDTTRSTCRQSGPGWPLHKRFGAFYYQNSIKRLGNSVNFTVK
ncbi:MAG: hypothetical protein ACJ8AW_55040 [Rhodopila sp.]